VRKISSAPAEDPLFLPPPGAFSGKVRNESS